MTRLSDYDHHKIIDDLKRIARIIPILRDERDRKQRLRLGQLALDELQKLTDDFEEIAVIKENSMESYDRNIKCPSCGRRKVYIKEEEDKFTYYCKACGHEWGG